MELSSILTPHDGQRSCPKPVEFCDRINLDNWCVWLVIKKKSVRTHGNMNVKHVLHSYRVVKLRCRKEHLKGSCIFFQDVTIHYLRNLHKCRDCRSQNTKISPSAMLFSVTVGN